MGELLATSAERVRSMIERMARSATPLKFPGVVTVKGAHDALRVGRALVEKRGEGREKAPDVRRRFRFVLEEVHGFEAGVVVDEDEH
eukprot:2757489-Pleurochrysis_carterae.AAC.1